MKDWRFFKLIFGSSKYGQPPTPLRMGHIIDTVTETMSIYPLSYTYLRLGIQTTFSPARFSIFSGDSEAFLGQIRYATLPASSYSTPQSPLEELCRKATRRHQNQTPQPTQLASFRIRMQRCSGSTLSFLQMSKLLNIPLRPATLWRKTISASCISLSFCHFPELMTMGEGWDFHLELHSDQNLWTRSQHT